MTIETDIAELKVKYGDKKGIKTADQIMRVVTELENRMNDCCVAADGICNKKIKEYLKHKPV